MTKKAANHTVYFGWLIGLAVAVAILAPAAHGQNYLTQVGPTTFSTKVPVELGYFDASTGDLHLEIPLGSWPQRGGFSLNAALVYDSRNWFVNNGVWSPYNINQPFTTGGWRLVTSPVSGGTTSYSTQVGYCIINNKQWSYTYYTNFTWIDPYGTQHDFPIFTENDPRGCDNGTNSSDAEFATDATGYTMHVTNYTNVSSITGPDGTQLYPIFKDRNGNYLNSSNMTDTLGRTVVTQTTTISPPNFYYSVLNSQGATSMYVSTYSPSFVQTSFGQSGVTEYSGNINVISSLQPPSGPAYTFTYDSYGELASITLPTGGTINYAYTNFTDVFGQANRWLYTRTSAGNTWTYAPSSSSACGAGFTACQQITETKPSGDQCVYAFGLSSSNNGAWLSTALHYNGSAGGTPLETDSLTWSSPTSYTQQLSRTVTWDTGLSSTVQYQYGTPFYNGDVTKISEWNSYTGTLPGTPTRITNISYASFTHPSSVTVTDGSGSTTISQTNTTYDSAALTSVTGAVNHDDANYGTGYTTRWNPTSVSRWLTGSSYLTTSMTYDTTGQLRSITDPNGNSPTTMSYADSFFDDNGSGTPAAHSGAPSTNAYLTQLTQPLIGSTYFGYYYGTGQQAKLTDVNNQTTYSHFYDPFSRPTQTNFPDGGWNLVNYADNTHTDLYTAITSTTPSTSCSGCRHDQTVLDTLGRVTSSVLASDPAGADSVDTSYDSSGRVSSVTNPHRSTGSPTDGTSSSAYDGLDRVTSVQRQDGSTAHAYYGNSVSSNGGTGSQLCSTGIGYPALSVDEAGKKRQSWTDGFGRLVEVDEPDGSNNLTWGTCYSYDLNNNLVGVNQGGQTRTYAYDALSRVTSVTTPESGTTTFTYDNNSNVHTRTDARSITTTYTYDALNRLTQEYYSNSTPTAYFYYDQSAPWGWGLSNYMGRMTTQSVNDHSTGGLLAAALFNYDPTGRIKLYEQCTTLNCSGNSYASQYNFDLSGNVSALWTGIGGNFGVWYTYNSNSAGQVTSLTSSLVDSQHPATLASVNRYWPTGQIQQLSYGNGLTEAAVLNPQLQPCRINANSSATYFTSGSQCTGSSPAGNVLDLQYNWNGGAADNGNLIGLAAAGQQTFNRSYTYDNVNRIASMLAPGDACSSLTWNYDQWGNRTSQAGSVCPNPSASYSGGNNRMDGYTYDAAGNVTNDGTHIYAYDAESRMISVDAGAIATYVYDASGQRVQKIQGSSTTNYFYDLQGRVVAEVNGSGSWQTGYAYLNGQLLSQYSNGTTYFVHGDHLGSTRLRTTVSGGVYDSFDYLPFGEVLSGINDYVPKFTGDALDNETGLDHTLFRQYSSSLGRWSSPDPLAGDISDPQSLNRYSYVNNSPLVGIDPLGLDTFLSENCTSYQQDYYTDGEYAGTDYFVPGPFCKGSIANSAGAGGGGDGGGGGATPGGGASGNGVQSFASCVRDGGRIFSAQGVLQFVSGGKLGNGAFSNVFLGNSISDAIETAQALTSGNIKDAAKAAVPTVAEKSSGPAATAVASVVPNVAFIDQTGGMVLSQTATTISVTATAETAIHVVPVGSLARAGASIFNDVLDVLEGPKMLVDTVGTGFGAVVCGIMRPRG